jgi:hypothetical protein
MYSVSERRERLWPSHGYSEAIFMLRGINIQDVSLKQYRTLEGFEGQYTDSACDTATPATLHTISHRTCKRLIRVHDQDGVDTNTTDE